jgi:hypothetical protein
MIAKFVLNVLFPLKEQKDMIERSLHLATQD